MYLKSLEVQGFKSFANKIVLSSTTASQVLSGQTAVERVMSPMRSDGCSVSRAQSSFVVPACRMLFCRYREQEAAWIRVCCNHT